MRLHLSLLPGLLALLGACESTAELVRPAPLPRASAEQRDLYERAILLFRVGGEEFGQVLREGRSDPVLVRALTMFLVFHMRDAAQRQRRAQRGGLEVRSLEDNERFTQARAGLGVLGAVALPTIRAELVEHRLTENRLFAITALTALGADAVPAIRDAMVAGKPRYRRCYVESVSGMSPAPKVERQLLEWARHPDFSVRSKALGGLAAYGDRHLLLLHRSVASDTDPFVQRHVVGTLGAYKDRLSVACVLDYYQRCVAADLDRGVRAAERALLQMSGKRPRHHGQQLTNYGLVFWQQWARTLPSTQEKR